MDDLLQDIKLSLRQLIRDPRTSAIIVLCAALAIGLNSSMFTVVNAFVIDSGGVTEPGELVRLYNEQPSFPYASLSYPNYIDLRDRNDVFTDLAASAMRPVVLTVDGESESTYAALATGNYFRTLGAQPARGRLISPDDDVQRGGHPVTVISDHLWQTRFGGRENIVGTKVLINSQPFTVIGVVADFMGTIPGIQFALWVPMEMQPVIMPSDTTRLDRRGAGWLATVGRLQPGMGLEQARAQLKVTAQNMKDEAGDDGDWVFGAHPGFVNMPPNVTNAFKLSGTVIMAMVFCVLLVACANVASLLLARAEARTKEISIRLAIGAGRRRLLRQLLTESMVLSMIGGVFGLLLAFGTARAFPSLMPSLGSPIEVNVQPDAKVFAFTLLMTLATGCLFGLIPALQATRPDLVKALKGEAIAGRRRHPMRHALVTAQVALSMILLVTAGLFVRSLQAERLVDPGFRTDNMVLAELNPSLHGYDDERALQLYDNLVDRVRTQPGVNAAALAEIAPMNFANSQQWGIEVEGYVPAEGERMNPDYNIVGDSYFEALGIAMRNGRGFERSDNADALPVMVVNQAMADRYWEGDAIGKRVRMGGTWREVVGITENSKIRSLREAAAPHMYLPLAQRFEPGLNLHVRTSGDPMAVVPSLRALVRELDPNMPLTNVRTMETQIEGSLFLQRMGAQLISAFGALAVVLAALGLFGLLTHGVVRRTREIGIRMAIGAGRRDVFAQLLREGLKLTAIGLGVGLLAAFAAGQILSGVLYNTAGTDPLTFFSVTAALLLTSIVAIAVPALRATRIEPITALRYE